MKVFISWSGERSKAVAEALRNWLPSVIQAVQPWLSISDIEKGARWMDEIAGQLEDADVGLVCLTPENLEKPWLLFEVGALSKALLKRRKKPLICTYLLDLKNEDIAPPLGQFQHTTTEKEDTRKLVHTINNTLRDEKLPTDQLDKTFNLWWDELEQHLNRISAIEEQPRPQRNQGEMIEEILELVRGQARRRAPEEITAEILELVRGQARRRAPEEITMEAALLQREIGRKYSNLLKSFPEVEQPLLVDED